MKLTLLSSPLRNAKGKNEVKFDGKMGFGFKEIGFRPGYHRVSEKMSN